MICADEKPSIQARRRIHATLPAAPSAGQKVEHEYERKGALCYLAAWDARRARIFDRCAPKDGIEPFDRLVEQFMSQHPYSRAQRVFLVIDNGSAHRGKRSIDRLQGAWPTWSSCTPPSTPPGSTRPRSTSPSSNAKVVTPNDFEDLAALEVQLLAFGRHYEQIAAPFHWTFTRRDLNTLLAKSDTTHITPLAA